MASSHGGVAGEDDCQDGAEGKGGVRVRRSGQKFGTKSGKALQVGLVSGEGHDRIAKGFDVELDQIVRPAEAASHDHTRKQFEQSINMVTARVPI